MGDPFGSREVTILRGDSLRDVRDRPVQAPVRLEPMAPANIAGNPPGAGQDSIYGVPVSAIQHCCGRGCKHCRIYWHGKKQ